jgi:hypothetical protein
MFRLARFTLVQFPKVLAGLLLCLGLVVTLDEGVADHVAYGTGLFQEDWPLEMDLFMDPKKFCRVEDKSKCQDVPARLSYSVNGQEDQAIDIPLLVKTRGSWRLRRDICTIPPLFLVFPEDQTQTKGTLFAGQDVLPLTTHCSSKQGRTDDYVLKEYLAYRIYNLFSEKSVRVRLAYIRYRKPNVNKLPKPHYAFFNEHFHSVAARNDAEMWETPRLNPAQADSMEMATMELFQYMIGNTDFSSLGQHNIVLLRTSKGQVTTLPFDFDFSGLVNAKYAGPDPRLPLQSNRQRLYRGFCHPDLDWDELFQRFIDKKAQVFELLDSTPGLTRRAQKSTRKFLNEFYEILDSPKLRQRNIVDACRTILEVD